MISAKSLIDWINNTAPFLFEERYFPIGAGQPLSPLAELAGHPFGFVKILRSAERLFDVDTDNLTSSQHLDYFALCLAAHHGTVATFIPTDVDNKIRAHLWHSTQDRELLRAMFHLSVQALNWDVESVSRRNIGLSGVGPVGGHHGELLGVLAGSLGQFITVGDSEYQALALAAIDAELKREAHEFRHVMGLRGREIELLLLTTILTHNVGDLDQGLSFWPNRPSHTPLKSSLGLLAHDNAAPYEGIYQLAAKLYKEIMAAEGHRHYPLRAIPAIRVSPEYLLPLGPFLDSWGLIIGRSSGLDAKARAQVLGGLLAGCRKIPNQQGYFRAINGICEVSGGSLKEYESLLHSSDRAFLKESLLRRHLGMAKHSFESSMMKRARELLPLGGLKQAGGSRQVASNQYFMINPTLKISQG